MESFIGWCGFVGAWLLVAGSIYQASLELAAEDFSRERFESVSKSIERNRASAWWWLLPPVKLYLERHNNEAYRQAFMAALPAEDMAAAISYMNKATGWVIVAGGGLLLALKESYELVVLHDWPLVLFWVLNLVMTLLAVGNTAYRSARTERVKQKHLT